jgi:hypothetical protein
MQHEEELRPVNQSPVGAGVLLIVVTAIVSGIVFLFTKSSCAGDGSFDPSNRARSVAFTTGLSTYLCPQRMAIAFCS